MQATQIIPILRIFDVDKAMEFYVGWLGFHIDWQHRFEPGTPLYMQVSCGGVLLHLSEHHGDSTPGAKIFIECTGVRELQKELMDKNYNYGRPCLEKEPWNSISVTVIDPFMNRLAFNEALPQG